MKNLAEDPRFTDVLKQMKARLMERLCADRDPKSTNSSRFSRNMARSVSMIEAKKRD